jgi:hypothetical protein
MSLAWASIVLVLLAVVAACADVLLGNPLL